MSLTQAFLKAYSDHTDTCALAIEDLDSAVMGQCPYCAELRMRASAAMNGFLDTSPPILDQAEWDRTLAGHATYRVNNPSANDDDLALYALVPPLPDGVNVEDLPAPRPR